MGKKHASQYANFGWLHYFLDFTFSNCFSANVAKYGALYIF